MPHGLPRKIRLAFILQTVLASLAIVMGGYLVSLVIKHGLVRSVLQDEATHYWQLYEASPVQPPPNTANIRGYLVPAGRSSLLLPDNLRPLAPGSEPELSMHDVLLVVHTAANVDDANTIYRRWRAEHRVDGIILLNPLANDPRIGVLTELNIPAVIVGDARRSSALPSVWTDDRHAGSSSGRRRIGDGHCAGGVGGARRLLRPDAQRQGRFHRLLPIRGGAASARSTLRVRGAGRRRVETADCAVAGAAPQSADLSHLRMPRRPCAHLPAVPAAVARHARVVG